MPRFPILGPAIPFLAPRERVRHLAWCREHIQTHEGQPYDHGAYPHLGAPGGPCDALDDPAVRVVWLMFASRLGKTFIGQTAQLKAADVEPCSMLFASADQKTATEVIQRTYGMLERCDRLKDQLRPEKSRNQGRVDLAHSRIYVGWARSVSTLADKGIKVGHANEIDKWEHRKTSGDDDGRRRISREADPLQLFDDRFKQYPSHKAVKESTPTVKGQSRIEDGLLQSTNCRYYVPCPHCGEYQVLRFENICWHGPDGEIVRGSLTPCATGSASARRDKELARKTAYYECAHCQGKIESYHRGRMMRAGVWAPEGCGVDSAKAKEVVSGQGSGVSDENSDHRPLTTEHWRGWQHAPWITGTPARDGLEAGYQLSSLYALSLTWGDIAAKWIECENKPGKRQNFINQWLGLTYEFVERQQTWEQLGERIIGKVPRGIVPLWASLLTAAADRQQDRYVWLVKAWGPNRKHATIAYGEAETLDQLRQLVLVNPYPHEDGGDQPHIAYTLVDSGYKPHGVYEFSVACVRQKLDVWPCKGSSGSLPSEYRQVTLGPNTAMPGMVLVHVDTVRTQQWIDRALHDLKPDSPDGFQIYRASLAEHRDYLEQLLNDAAVHETDRYNNDREAWSRVSTSIPNDFRDAERYAYVAMLIHTRGAPIRPRGEPVKKRTAVISAGATRPDGRAW